MAKKTSPKKIDYALRRGAALKLRVAGIPYPVIADRLKYSSVETCRKDIQKGIKSVVREPAEELVDIELMRLDHLTVGLMQEFDQGDRKMVDQILRVMVRRSAYLGLDHEKRKDVGNSDIDQWLAGMVGDKPDLELDPDDVLGEEVEEVDDLE